MTPGLEALNRLPEASARDAFLRCCGSNRWAEAMTARRPFADEDAVFEAAREVWRGLEPRDRLEAFAAHPRIGDLEHLRERFASTRAWAAGEQGGVAEATEDELRRLAEGNRRYEERFGFIFIVCATGKSAGEMASLLEARLANPPGEELRIAAGEQEKITRIRLEKLLSEEH
ncbi:2-oxo-4-hydroxy-4-carboxy-5-ureidoimidazoline decarboxylase [Rhodocaloribacter sp.]